MRDKLLAVHFGAGNIGRGFIARVLSRNNYHVTFVDIDKEMIQRLAEAGRYTAFVHGAGNSEDTKGIQGVAIEPVTAVQPDDAQLQDYLTSASLITTAVGVNAIKHLALPIAKNIKTRCKEQSQSTQNIIACENAINATSTLKELVYAHLEEKEIAYANSAIGFVNCVIDGIVPPQVLHEADGSRRIDVDIEAFSEWVCDGGAFVGSMQAIDGMRVTDALPSYVERKLFTLNTAHAITAYLGYAAKIPTIHQAIQDPTIKKIVLAAMHESGSVLIQKFNFDPKEHEEYIHSILNRFRTTALGDTPERVGRDPGRKLGARDRIIYPLCQTVEMGLAHENLLIGVASALAYNNPEDKESVAITDDIRKNGIEKVISTYLPFADPHIVRKIRTYYESIVHDAFFGSSQ